jgi:hypothetical protein
MMDWAGLKQPGLSRHQISAIFTQKRVAGVADCKKTLALEIQACAGVPFFNPGTAGIN